MIFVFGSNRSGIHGAGAAAYAHKNLGAEWGVGEGPTDESHCEVGSQKDELIPLCRLGTTKTFPLNDQGDCHGPIHLSSTNL